VFFLVFVGIVFIYSIYLVILTCHESLFFRKMNVVRNNVFGSRLKMVQVDECNFLRIRIR
jgi:hypothetical protein